MIAINDILVVEKTKNDLGGGQKCICDVETLSPKSTAAAIDEDETLANSLESCSPDALYEIMRFLYPTEWGKLGMTSTSMANTVIPISEHLISSYLPPHLLLTPIKSATRIPDPWTIDEFRICDPLKPEKSWTSTYHQIASTAATIPMTLLLRWGPNMCIYQRLITMDISGVWRVDGSYTNGERYFYTMKLQQGPRRGESKLEAFVEGEVLWSETDVMVIGGKIDGNMAVFHEMMLNRANVLGSHLANVVSAVLCDNGLFMSGAWLQHDTHLLRVPDEPELLRHPHDHIDHHYPLRVLCSGIFRATKAT